MPRTYPIIKHTHGYVPVRCCPCRQFTLHKTCSAVSVRPRGVCCYDGLDSLRCYSTRMPYRRSHVLVTIYWHRVNSWTAVFYGMPLYCGLTFISASMRQHMTWKERNKEGYIWAYCYVNRGIWVFLTCEARHMISRFYCLIRITPRRLFLFPHCWVPSKFTFGMARQAETPPGKNQCTATQLPLYNLSKLELRQLHLYVINMYYISIVLKNYRFKLPNRHVEKYTGAPHIGFLSYSIIHTPTPFIHHTFPSSFELCAKHNLPFISTALCSSTDRASVLVVSRLGFQCHEHRTGDISNEGSRVSVLYTKYVKEPDGSIICIRICVVALY